MSSVGQQVQPDLGLIFPDLANRNIDQKASCLIALQEALGTFPMCARHEELKMNQKR